VKLLAFKFQVHKFIMSGPNHTVYVLDPYHADALSLLQTTPNIKAILPNDPVKSSWHDHADGIILRSESKLTATDFARAKKLKVVVKQGVGVDNIDLAAAREHGVAVHNTPALNSETVAELCMALTLALSRRVCEIDRLVRKGEKVVRSEILGMSMFRKTVGVVGMGNVGKVVAQKWRGAFECDILGYDPLAKEGIWSDVPHERLGNLEGLLRRADMVTLHVPLLESTKGMIGEKELGLMKGNAILVNCARGGVVDEKALLKIIREKRIWGAALDAMEVEPPTLEAYGEFLECGNLIITPHVGASTIENQSKSGVTVVETLLKVLNGEEAAGKLV
jgi:D-3-phosphoglycerate dehydrogenase